MNEPVTWQVELPDTHHRVAVGPMTASYAIETDENYLILYEPSAYVLLGVDGARQVMCTGIHSASTLEATLASPSKLPHAVCKLRSVVLSTLTSNCCQSIQFDFHCIDD